MAEPLSDQIMGKLKQAAGLYHRLVLVVASSGAGKTSALQDVRKHTGAPLMNANLELSRRLLDLTERQRALQVQRLLDDILSQVDNDVILLDNIEILFDISLKQDPLRLLQGLSRNRTVVAAWNGSLVNGYLTYVTPDHPEYRRYPAQDLIIATP